MKLSNRTMYFLYLINIIMFASSFTYFRIEKVIFILKTIYLYNFSNIFEKKNAIETEKNAIKIDRLILPSGFWVIMYNRANKYKM